METGTVAVVADTRPARIFIGFWKKQPVYGILAKNELFRVRTAKKWISYEEFELQPRMEHLSRAEVMRYCRIRQHQIKDGETEDTRLENEAIALCQSRSPETSQESHQNRRIQSAVSRGSTRKRVPNSTPRPLLPKQQQFNRGAIELHKSENIQRLNEVWARQEALREKAGTVEAKIHGQIKYERKEKGSFAGYYASDGQMLCIDDEDFVEYRVLLKPI